MYKDGKSLNGFMLEISDTHKHQQHSHRDETGMRVEYMFMLCLLRCLKLLFPHLGRSNDVTQFKCNLIIISSQIINLAQETKH